MRYEVISELGVRKFRKIERLRDFLWIYFPQWLDKLTVYKVHKSGLRFIGQFINSKKVITFK